MLYVMDLQLLFFCALWDQDVCTHIWNWHIIWLWDFDLSISSVLIKSLFSF